MTTSICAEADNSVKDPRRRLAWLSLGGLLAASVVLVLGLWLIFSGGPSGSPVGPPAPSFTLHTLDGDKFDPSKVRGRPFAVFFGFTNCPVICPTTMRELTDWLTGIGEPARDFPVYFVTVDPERDTPGQLKEYLGNFAPQIVGLTGTPDEIAQAAKAMSVYYRKVPTSGGYTMEHTALIFLFDAQGRRSGELVYGVDREAATNKLRGLIGGKF